MESESSQIIQVEVKDLQGKVFQTRDELLEDVKLVFSAKGYATSIKNSRKDDYVNIGCDRGGVYRDRRKNPLLSHRRETGTRLGNCPFKVQGKRKSDGRWTLNLVDISHNHDPSKDMAGHPSCRRLAESEILEVERMSTCGIQPRNILSSLRLKNPNTQAVSKTIYNAKMKIRIEKLDGRSMIEALFEELSRAGFKYNYKRDEKGHLTHVFFAHPKSIMLSKIYRKVYVLDCTYKTNMYKMPLLDIIGVSGSNKSFYSCFVFLKKEREEDYVWALMTFRDMIDPTFEPLVIVSDRDQALMRAILVVFPRTAHLLCIWHIQKNVVAKCKPQFNNDEDWQIFFATWNALMYAQTEGAFNESWLMLELLYKEKNVVSYLKETWLQHKEKFVTAWTDKYPHFGNRVSSRAEGAHAKLKGYLQVSTGDFAQVVTKINLAVENEFEEINTTLESERIRVPHRCRIFQLKFLLNHVSHFALGLLYKQYEMVKFGTLKPECTGHFVATMGLPCAHMINNLKESSLPLSGIDSQWRIDTVFLTSRNDASVLNDENGITGFCDKLQDKYREASMDEKKEMEEELILMLQAPKPLLLEPNIQTAKGRPHGSLNKRKYPTSSTKRNPSEFEIVEAVLAQKNKSKIAKTSGSQRGIEDLDSPDTPEGSALFGIDLNPYTALSYPFSLDTV